MKRRHQVVVFFAALALIFTSLSGSAANKKTDISPRSSSEPVSSTSSSQQTSKSNQSNVYIVRRGDSLSRIARIYNTTPYALMSLNNLSSSKILIGQKIKVNGAPNVTAANKKDTNVSRKRIQDVIPDADTTLLRYRLVEAGFDWLGVRYRFSGTSKTNGVDCSGLVKRLFSKFNIDVPRSSWEQFRQGEKVDRAKLDAGDLVFFSSGGRSPTHVGIYLGNDKFLHAASNAKKVIISDLSLVCWRSMRYLGARRIKELWGEGQTATSSEKQ